MNRRVAFSPSAQYLLKAFLLCAAYIFLAYFSLEFTAVNDFAALIWPATGITLAALYLWGVEYWPAVTLGAFIVNILAGAPPPAAFIIAIGNTLEGVLAVHLLRRYVGLHPLLSRLRDSLGLITVGVFLPTAVSATFGVVALRLAGLIENHQITSTWSAWWVGDMIGMLVFAPFLLSWLYATPHKYTWWELLEGVLGFGSIAALTYFMSWTEYTVVWNVPLLYALLVLLIWAALRTGPRGTTLAFVLITLVGGAGILMGDGATVDSAQQLLYGQIFIGMLSIIFLLFTSIVEERKENARIAKERMDQLQEAMERVRAEDKAKTDFLAVLAHELRNPLSPILSGLELLKARGNPQEEVLMMMGAHLHTVARLLDDLLDMTRISQKKFKLQKEAVELRTIINQTLEMVRPYIDSRHHTLEVHLPEEPVWLDGDPVRLGQIFVNVLNNSGKYTDPGGKISLSARVEEGDVLVLISDNGIGIAPERLEKVFEPFAPDAPARKPGGLRIGLSLAKRMAELHHGTIEARSAGLGYGSEFLIRLPLLRTTPLPLQDQPRVGARTRFTRRAGREGAQRVGALPILLVDDNEPAAQSLGQLLEHHGHEVRLAYSGPQALEILKEFVPQVALLDIGLPGMDGHELARAIREQFDLEKKMVLIALTGYGQEEDRKRALEAGFDNHLVKPVALLDIQNAIEKHVR